MWSPGLSVVGPLPAPHALIYPEATKWYVSGIANEQNHKCVTKTICAQQRQR